MSILHIKVVIQTAVFLADVIWVVWILSKLWSMPGRHRLISRYGQKQKISHATSSRKKGIGVTVVLLLANVTVFCI